jgi:hypothetical protein
VTTDLSVQDWDWDWTIGGPILFGPDCLVPSIHHKRDARRALIAPIFWPRYQ